MCTLAALVPPAGSGLPIVVAANRDEMLDRPALPFDRHWAGKPWRAGRDGLAGGTWGGIHDDGYGVFLLNRERSLGPEAGKRSRGLLALDLLEAGGAERAVAHALALPPGEYRPFHALIAG
ncbi:NRDE family protein, partial [bacterium]|nr:NRDE family protein [bacterium]